MKVNGLAGDVSKLGDRCDLIYSDNVEKQKRIKNIVVGPLEIILLRVSVETNTIFKGLVLMFPIALSFSTAEASFLNLLLFINVRATQTG
jgi:hypothetical protein